MRQKRSKSNSSCWGSVMTCRVEVLGLLEGLHMEREPNKRYPRLELAAVGPGPLLSRLQLHPSKDLHLLECQL